MLRICAFMATAAALSVMIVATPAPANAQTGTPAAKTKLTREKLGEMRAKWKANKPKLKACRADSRKKGLAGDDRWFFIEECMDKS
jgi:hypothetical protein